MSQHVTGSHTYPRIVHHQLYEVSVCMETWSVAPSSSSPEELMSSSHWLGDPGPMGPPTMGPSSLYVWGVGVVACSISRARFLLLPVRVFLIFTGDFWVTVWAIFPILAAAFSKNEGVGIGGECARGCRVICCDRAAPPSDCGVLVVCAGMGCEYLLAMVRLREWVLVCFSLLLSLMSSILLQFGPAMPWEKRRWWRLQINRASHPLG